MKPFLSFLRILSVTLLLLPQAGNTLAQKLPNIQAGGLYVSRVKVDGVSSEWQGGYQAYNKSTDIYYSIGNDANNLYLTVQASDLLIIRKIINGSVKFSINSKSKAIAAGSISISYPIYLYGDYPFNLQEYEMPPKDMLQRKKYLDSIHTVLTQQFRAKSKDIEVSGIKGAPDTLISMYNEFGINVSSAFSNNLTYTYELSIPLKLLGLDPSAAQQFFYNIQLPAFRPVKANRGGQRPPPPPPVPMKDRTLYSPTDFWADYTLKSH